MIKINPYSLQGKSAESTNMSFKSAVAGSAFVGLGATLSAITRNNWHGVPSANNSIDVLTTIFKIAFIGGLFAAGLWNLLPYKRTPHRL